jgi:hypothetical protein
MASSLSSILWSEKIVSSLQRYGLVTTSFAVGVPRQFFTLA